MSDGIRRDHFATWSRLGSGAPSEVECRPRKIVSRVGVAAVLGFAGLLAAGCSSVSSDDAAEHMDTEVAQAIKNGKSTSVIVFLKDVPNVDAVRAATKEDRGRQVYQLLTAHANRTQAD